MQHFSEITNYPPPRILPLSSPYPPPYSEPPQFRQILEPVSVLPLLASSSARPQAAALRVIKSNLWSMRDITSAIAVLFEIMQHARMTFAKSPPGTTVGGW